MVNNYHKVAAIYAKHENKGTAFLAFKHVPEIISEFSNGIKTLDYGCGTGTSSRFLKDIGLDVIGVDINEVMLKEAISQEDTIVYKKIKSANIPFENSVFNIVFSSFVLFEIPTKNEIHSIIQEIYRVLTSGGIFIAITGSTDMYLYPWLSLDVDFSENKNLTSGKLAKVHLKQIDLTVYDYYWTDSDYLEIFNKTNFTLVNKIFPLGDENDPYPWLSETKKSPYVIYVLKK